MTDKPVLLITRKISANSEKRAAETYDVRLNPEDRLYSSEELLEKCEGVDAILPCHSEFFTPEVVAQLPESVKIIANHSVGVDAREPGRVQIAAGGEQAPAKDRIAEHVSHGQ